jgi:hypothetical protein
MDGAIAEGRLRAAAHGIQCRVATPSDDADLRALLRENPMGGWVSVAMEREPSFFAPLVAGEEHEAVIARDTATGRAVGMCARTIRPVYVDGEARPLGYIGELRIAPDQRHRFHIIREGFKTLQRELHRPDLAPYCLTAIVADNVPARRLLEAELPGKPTYRPIADCTTLAIRTQRGRAAPAMRAGPKDAAGIADCLARNHTRYQFAPVWTEADICDAAHAGGPGPRDFLLYRTQGGIAACLALWDQSRQRQAVIRGYRRPIDRLRPWLNAVSAFTGVPPLPRAGEALRLVYLSYMAVDGDDPAIARKLVAAGLKEARRRGFDLAMLAMANSNPMLAPLRRSFRARDYCSKLYLVHWPEGREAVEDLAPGVVHVEAGLL